MTVEFTGSPPHDLPVAQSASAEHVDGTVQLTFRALDARTQKIVPVRIRLAAEAARYILAQLPACATAAEQWRRIHGS
jgi:hypothetical protein